MQSYEKFLIYARESRFILYLSYVYGIFILYLWYVVGWERVGDREQGVRNREYGAGGCEKIFVLLLWNGDFFITLQLKNVILRLKLGLKCDFLCLNSS